MEVRGRGLTGTQLVRPVGALSSQHHSLESGFNHNRLMAGGVAGGGKQTDTVGDVLVTADESQPVLRDIRPVRNVRCSQAPSLL